MKIETKKKLDYLEETKDLIRSAIEAKGQSIADSDTFRSYADKISSIESGSEPVIHPLSITENGTYTAPANVDGYNPIVVEVPSEEPVLQDKEITENGSYSADEGFDGLGTVTVNIPDPTKTVILAEQEIPGFALDDTLGYSVYDFEPTYEITEGEKYLVAWDGVTYETTAVSADSYMEGVLIIGNGSLIGLPGNDEPFLIGYLPGTVMYIAFTDDSESHTVGIWQKLKTEFQLQDKTITENGEYTADEGFDGLGKVTVDVVGSSEELRYVTFKNHDGTVEYGKKAVAVGDDCADPIARGIFAKPTRESDAQYNYTFYGWATTPNGAADANWNKAVTEDKTVYANFASAVRYYTITYYDEDGTTVLKTESLAYGAMPSYEPSKEGFKLSGWVPSATVVTEDASYTAQWKALSGLNFLSKATPTENVQFFAVGNDGQNVVTSKGGTSINYCMRYDTTNEVATESKLATRLAGYPQSVDINFDGTTVRLVNYSSYGSNYVNDINFSGDSSYASIRGGQQVTCSPSSNLYCYYIYANNKSTLHFSDGTSVPDFPDMITKLIITKNDKYVLCTVSGRKEVYVVDIATKTIAATVTTNISSFSGLDVSADGTKFVVTGYSGKLPEVYSLETFEKICDFSNVLSGTVYAAFAGDFLLVASGSSVRAFEIVDSAPVENWDIPVYSGGNVSKMQSSSNKKYVAIYDGTNIEVWVNV